MSLLSRLRRQIPAPAAPQAGAERELQSLERQAAEAAPGFEMHHLNRAGDLCAGAGDVEQALAYYGRAIDACIQSGRVDAAEVMCRKILRLSPGSVRPHRTLAWLALAKRYYPEVEQAARAYAVASWQSGHEARAAENLSALAEYAGDEELLEKVGELLLWLGDSEAADRVFGRVHQARNGGEPLRLPGREEVWNALVSTVVTDPEPMAVQGAQADGLHGAYLT